MPLFEMKSSTEERWKKVSEKEFLESLVDNVAYITPTICEMFKGKEFNTPSGAYRINTSRDCCHR